MAKKIHYRHLHEISDDSFANLSDMVGDAVVWNKRTVDVFRDNPFADDSNAIVQIIGSVDGNAVATSSSLPLDVYVNGRIFRTAAGHDMRVSEKYRSSQFGLKLPIERLKSTPNNFYISAAQSQMMIKVQEFLKCAIFYMPRLVMLFKSRSVVETKLKGAIGWGVTKIIDCGLSVYWFVLRLLSKWVCRGIVFERVCSTDNAKIDKIVEIVSCDKHPCGEVHDARWFKWLLTHSFEESPVNELVLMKKAGKPVAFVMFNRRFFAKASHRGFRNVWLSTILEWGGLPECETLMPALIMCTILKYIQGCDAVQILGTDEYITAYFKRKLWKQVGDGHFVIKVGKGSPLEEYPNFLKQDSWRLRPAMGDAGFI